MLYNRSSWLALGLSGFLVAPVFADTVTFKDGREVHGRLIEESKDEIIVQVGQGKLRFLKTKVATFTEDSDYGQGYFKPPRRGEATDAGSSTQSGRYWTRHKEASPDELKDLKGVHARLEEEYAKLGVSPEARARRLELSAVDRGSLDNAIAGLGHTRGTADISPFGLKAVPALVDVLQSGDVLAKAAAAQAIADVAGRGDADDSRWVMQKHKVSTLLLGLLEASGDENSGAVRTSADKALEQISGTQYGWVDSKDSYPSESQRDSIKQWRLWASKDNETNLAGDKRYAEGAKKLDDVWKSLEDPKAWREALALAKDTYGVSAATPKDDSGTPKPAGADLNGDVAKAATPEEQKALADLKSKIKTTLDKTIGMSLDDLKAKYALTSVERDDIDLKLHVEDGGQRRGRGTKEQNATEGLAAYGLKVIDALVASLDSAPSPWQGKNSAAVLGTVVNNPREDGLRLMLAAHGPSKISALLVDASDERSADVRNSANKALESISGTSFGWIDNSDQQPTDVQTAASGKWRSWATTAESDAARREKSREEHRKKLAELLKDLDRASKWREGLEKGPKMVDAAEKDLKV